MTCLIKSYKRFSSKNILKGFSKPIKIPTRPNSVLKLVLKQILKLVLKQILKLVLKLALKLVLKLVFETSFKTGFETDRVVLVVERSKRKNGSKRFQGKNEMMEDVSHPKTMPLALVKKFSD